jgi:hypothetical protein
MLLPNRTLGRLAIVALCALIASPSLAQQDKAPPPVASDEPAASRAPTLVPPGVIMGPGMMRGGQVDRSCDPRMVGLAGWRIDRLEKALALSAEQKARLDDVRAASEKAVEHFVANCPRAMPLTPTGRLELMENRLTAMLEGVRTLRTAFDAFYGSLNDEQKAHLTPDARERGWRFEEAGADDEDRPRRRGRRR